MQHPVRRSDLFEEGVQRRGDARLVDLAHVDALDSGFLQGRTLCRVDRAQADDGDIIVGQRVGQIGEGIKALAPCHIAQRRAVQVAAVGAFGRVEIAMRVQPQHKQGAF